MHDILQTLKQYNRVEQSTKAKALVIISDYNHEKKLKTKGNNNREKKQKKNEEDWNEKMKNKNESYVNMRWSKHAHKNVVCYKCWKRMSAYEQVYQNIALMCMDIMSSSAKNAHDCKLN